VDLATVARSFADQSRPRRLAAVSIGTRHRRYERAVQLVAAISGKTQSRWRAMRSDHDPGRRSRHGAMGNDRAGLQREGGRLAGANAGNRKAALLSAVHHNCFEGFVHQSSPLTRRKTTEGSTNPFSLNGGRYALFTTSLSCWSTPVVWRVRSSPCRPDD